MYQHKKKSCTFKIKLEVTSPSYKYLNLIYKYTIQNKQNNCILILLITFVAIYCHYNV